MDDEKERALIKALSDPSFSHSENILVALRKHEAAGTSHEATLDDLHERFIQ